MMNVIYMWGLGIIFAVSTVTANAQAVHGVLRVVKGDVQIKSGKDGKSTKARVGEKVFPKDTVITAKDARAKIVMVDNNEINVSPETQIEIQNYEYDPAAGKKDVLLNVIYGKVRNKVEQKYDGKTSKFQIKTPSAVAGVRGTDFLTGHVGGVTNVVTFEGKVELGTPGPNGTITNPVSVTPGNTASVSPGGGVTPPSAVPKGDLAKMDSDSKAESKGDGGNKGSDQRTPAGDDKSKKEDKKDETKNKEADGSDKNKGSGNDKNGNNGKGAGGPGSPGGGAGDDGGGGNNASPGSGTADGETSGGRTPAADGGCTMCDQGPAVPPGSIDVPPQPPTMVDLPPMPVGPPPQTFDPNLVNGGNTNLTIHVNTN